MLISTRARMQSLAAALPRYLERKEDAPDPFVALRDQVLEAATKKMTELRTAMEAQIEALKATGVSNPEAERLIKLLGGRLDQLETELKRPEARVPPVFKSVGEQFTECDQFKDWMKRGWHRGGAAMKIADLWPQEYKTTITSAAVGSSTPGILVPERVPGIIPKPLRRLTLRDLIPSGPTTHNAIEFLRENVFTNTASPVAEEAAKPESALTFTIASAGVKTIAHWIPATKQILDDFAELQAYINNRLLYGLKLEEEFQLLKGDGVGAHLSGFVPNSTAYAGTYLVTNDNKLDTLRHAILEAEIANEFVTGIVMHPKDVHDIDLLKTEEGGVANKGSYLISDPTGALVMVPTYWGKPVVQTTAMTSGKFLVGAFATQSKIYDRMEAVIDISTEHSDYFIKNLVAIRAEERLALAIFRTTAFTYGSF